MKVKKVILLLLFCLTHHLTALCQENYVQGYIVTTNGDTLRGEVDYRNWRINPRQVHFKKTGQSASRVYMPIEIKAFHAGGDSYLSGIVEAEKSSKSVMNIDRNPEFIIETDTAFLHALVTGDKSLFHYIDTDDRENFYIGTDKGFELLKYKQYLVTKYDVNLKQTRKLYVGQLINYLSDCETIQKSASNILYSKTSLIKAFKDYYACTSKKEQYSEKVPKHKLDVGVLAGVSGTSLSHGDLSSSFDPSIGFTLNAVFPRSFGRWSLNNTILLTRFTAEDTYSYTSRLGRYFRYDYSIELISLKLHSMLRYTTHRGNIRYFFNGGPLIGYTSATKNRMEIRSKFGPDGYTEVKPAFDSEELPIGYVVGLGSFYQRFSLETRFENTKGLYSAFDSRSLYLMLGYRLNK